MRKTRVDRTVRSDVVVVGGGAAGLMVALGAKPLSVTVVTKSRLGKGSSSWLAQGGVAAAWDEDDSPELHAGDTLAVGAGLSDSRAVDLVTREGPALIARLLDLGTAFDRDGQGRLDLGREAAHSRRRIVHANGDATGSAIIDALTRSVLDTPGIAIAEECFAVELLLRDGRVIGVLGRDREGVGTAFLAPATVLATGGIGSLFLWTTNPPEATGDGLAMAARAGARLVDLEFMQFHPTALACGESPLPLLTEALRGEGAVLLDAAGERFMAREHPLAELAPRDVVARAIWSRLQEGGQVFLDARDAVGERFPQRFPTVFNLCRGRGLDPRGQPIPVCPAAHYHIGGVATDLQGRASLPGLWACGETAATGVHGANRLASNSLLEALVFGNRVAEGIKSDWRPRKAAKAYLKGLAPVGSDVSPESVETEIRRVMWEKVGLVRDKENLTLAVEELTRLEAACGAGRLRNMAAVGRLVAWAALQRRESRGVHYRLDFPHPIPDWERHLYLIDPLPRQQRARAAAAQ
jgi:L-aspartate oxidase